MKTKLLVLCLLIPVFGAFSQGNKKADYEKRREEMKAQKVAFITEKVVLTPEEAQKFWSLYNEKEEKVRQTNKEMRKMRKEQKADSADFAKMNETCINAELKKAELGKEYYEKFKQVLSDEKIYKLYQAEKDFQKQLLSKIRQNKPFRK